MRSSIAETWRAVVNYEGIYDVSNHGRARRMVSTTNTFAGKILKPWTSDSGYHRVRLCKNVDQQDMSIHSLVIGAFIGEQPEGEEVNHIDGNKLNNNVANLEYITHSGNVRHAYMTGLTKPARGESHHNAKLTESDVFAIRQLIGKESNTSIGRKFHISRPAICDIASGKRWGWLT